MGNAWPLSHEKLAVVGRIKPASKTAAAEATSDIVDMKYWVELYCVFNMGDYAAGNDGSVAVKIALSNSSSFATEVDSEVELTTASFTGSAQDDAVGVLVLRQEQCIVSGTEYRYARLSVTPSNQNLTCGAVLLGVGGRYQPASDYDISAVTEIAVD